MQIILFIAVVFGTLNIIGGFIVTDRMLGTFKSKKPVPQAKSGSPGRDEVAPMNLNYTVAVLYIISFSLFINGLMRLTGP